MKERLMKFMFLSLCVLILLLSNFSLALALVADFTPSSTIGTSTDIFEFTEASTGGAPTVWAWEFGDGSTATRSIAAGHVAAHKVKHTYSSAGTYPVKLTVTNGGGSSTEKIISVTVSLSPPSTASTLTASFIHVRNSSALDVVFANTSTGPHSSWTWDFGDGTVVTTRNTTHTYAGVGSYPVRLIIEDAAGQTASKTHTVTVPIPFASAAANVRKPVKKIQDCENVGAGYSGDLPEWRMDEGEWTVGLAAQAQALKYDFATKKAGFNSGVGGGVSFRFYQDVDISGVGVRRISQIRTECRMSTWQTQAEAWLPKATPLFSISPIAYVTQLTGEDNLRVEPAIMLGFFDDIVNIGPGFNLTGKDGEVGDVFFLLSIGAGFNW